MIGLFVTFCIHSVYQNNLGLVNECTWMPTGVLVRESNPEISSSCMAELMTSIFEEFSNILQMPRATIFNIAICVQHNYYQVRQQFSNNSSCTGTVSLHANQMQSSHDHSGYEYITLTTTFQMFLIVPLAQYESM